MKQKVQLRIEYMRYTRQKIDGLTSRLKNPQASLEDSFITGADRAKLLEIEILRQDLKNSIGFIERIKPC